MECIVSMGYFNNDSGSALHVNETIVCENISLDDLGVVEEDVTIPNVDCDSRVVERLYDLTVFKIVGVSDPLQGMGTVQKELARYFVDKRLIEELTAMPLSNHPCQE